jgi:hypothetical protein
MTKSKLSALIENMRILNLCIYVYSFLAFKMPTKMDGLACTIAAASLLLHPMGQSCMLSSTPQDLGMIQKLPSHCMISFIAHHRGTVLSVTQHSPESLSGSSGAF